jgi:single-stranded DNA-binding protein
MIGMNRFEILGEVASAPVEKTTANGKRFVSFYVKSDKEKADGEKFPNYYEMLVWGDRLSERVKEHVIKGCPIFCEGSISASAYTNRAGERRTSISLFLGNFSTEQSAEMRNAPVDPYYSRPSAPVTDIDTSDMPF